MAASDDYPAAPARILVIDDDPGARAQVAELLRGAIDAVEVVEIRDHVGFFDAIKVPFDAVVTELLVHWSSGEEIVNAVQSLRPTAPIVILTTAVTEDLATPAPGTVGTIARAGEFGPRLLGVLRRALGLDGAPPALTATTASVPLLARLGLGRFSMSVEGALLEADSVFLELLGASALSDVEPGGLFADDGARARLLEGLDADGTVRAMRFRLRASERHEPQEVAVTATVSPGSDGEPVIEGFAEPGRGAGGWPSPEGDGAGGRAEAQLRTVLRAAGSAIVVLDEDMTIADANPQLEMLVGYPPEQVVERMCLTELVARGDLERVRELHGAVLDSDGGSTAEMELGLVHRDGRRLHSRLTMGRMEDTRRVVASLLDLTGRRSAEEQLLHQAFFDPLTGLPNRASLLDRLEALVEEGVPFAVLLLGVDRFRVVNESLGHEFGDHLLEAVTRRLRGALSSVDTVARFGGDTFAAVVAPMPDPGGATIIADSVREAFRTPFAVDGTKVYRSISVGVAFADGAADVDALVRGAESALEEAKRLGRDQTVLFHPGLEANAREAFELENDLRRALADGGLRLVYQPIASLSEGAIVGFEALLRWQHPERGLLEPAQFLAVAEASGLIHPIGRWVVGEACRHMAVLQAAVDRPLWIGVNVGRGQFEREDLVETVRSALMQSELTPESLALELSEGLLMRDVDRSETVLSDLAELGVGVCVDDFGAGASSLGALHRLRFQTVKVDRSFLADIGADEDRWRVVAQVHTLARHLGLKVIVEGIETRSQLERLQRLGCELGQGRLFSGPVDGSTAEKLLHVDLMW